MRAELISIAAMLAAVGVSIWLLDWAQRGWREIAREPVEAWGDVPFVPPEARAVTSKGAEGEGSPRKAGHRDTHNQRPVSDSGQGVK